MSGLEIGSFKNPSTLKMILLFFSPPRALTPRHFQRTVFEMLEFSDVIVSAQNQNLLLSVSGKFPSGQVNALYGPNGAGKTTLLHFFQGSLTNTHALEVTGQFSIHAASANSLSPHQRAQRILCLGSAIHAPFDHTLDEYLAIVANSLSVRTEIELDEVLLNADLTNMRHRPVASLSSGEKQRLLLVRALYQKADWVILDETLSQLDPGSLAFAEDVLRKLIDIGAGVLVVTHDVRWVLRNAAKVIVLREGRVIADGAPKSVITKELLSKLYPRARPESLADLTRG